MYENGIVRRVDDLGRIVIPKEARKRYGIREGTPMKFLFKEGYLTLAVYEPDKEVDGDD